jgi:hypothetical protein
MTQADTDRIIELSRLISQEHDAAKFQELVTELNQLLSDKEEDLKTPPE